MIKKVKEGYRVVSEKSGRNIGTDKKKDEAKERRRQVEFFKHMNAKTKEKKYMLLVIKKASYCACLFYFRITTNCIMALYSWEPQELQEL